MTWWTDDTDHCMHEPLSPLKLLGEATSVYIGVNVHSWLQMISILATHYRRLPILSDEYPVWI